MTEEKKIEWGKYRGCYLGLAGAPKTGLKKDGSTWTRSALNFTHADGKNATMGTFLDTNTLSVGHYYFVEYKAEEYNHPEHGKTMPKTALKILDSTKDEQQGYLQDKVKEAVVQATVTQPQQTLNQPLPSMTPDIKGFAVAYRQNGKKPMSEKTIADFVGNYIFKYDKELFIMLKKVYDTDVAPNTD